MATLNNYQEEALLSAAKSSKKLNIHYIKYCLSSNPLIFNFTNAYTSWYVLYVQEVVTLFI